MRATPVLAALLCLLPAAVAAQRETGPLVHSAGAVFDVPSPDMATRPDVDYAVAFELAAPSSDPARLNAGLNTVARYLNMHAQAGVPRDRLRAAVVVHGPAAFELLDDAAYRERHGVDNPNAELIRELTSVGARVILCGQTAASRGVPTDQLVDGVEVALSAMTAFVLLQEEGYRVNPW